MAKISKIRFINFTYNENRHIYDQTFDFYNGEDVLLSLQNGGGKTVLVQMMMQPIIPKQRLKDRVFKNYFTHSKAPVYILIEWLLDGNSKKVMTGIGVKKIQGKNIEDETESLKVVTFISEYESESDFDIHNIQLLESEKGIVRLIEFEKVLKNLSNAEKEGNAVSLFRWELADDKREYSRRLLSYKINQLEWKNLMVKINEAEAGLNSFFNDCKTNSALIKKWFIPTIEEQLSKNGNFVDNIKELIQNHAEQLVKNEHMIQEREVFESFKRKSSELVKNLESYRELLESADKNKLQLGNAYLVVGNSIDAIEGKKLELATGLKEIEEALKQLDYEKLSGEYYEIDDILQKLKEETDKAEANIIKLKDYFNEQQYNKNLLLCSKLRDEIKNIDAKIAKFETELERENLQQQDIKGIIKDIEYSLRKKYSDKISHLENRIKLEKELLDDEKSRLSQYELEQQKAKSDISALNDRLIEVRGRMSVVTENEGIIRNTYPDFELTKNLNTGEYDAQGVEKLKETLQIQEVAMLKKMEEIAATTTQNINELDFVENECRALRNKHPLVAIEKNKSETEYHKYLEAKKSMDKIIKSYQLNENSIFEKEKLMIVLGADKEKYSKLVNDKHVENTILKKQYAQYESGVAFELSEGIKKILEDSNIFVEFGYEWLRSINDSKNAKMRLVKNNPFLPYSLIVSKNDIKVIQDMEIKGILSSIIPVIERETLEKSLQTAAVTRSRNSLHTIDGMDFLIAFDDRLLNKNYMKEICDDISLKLDSNNKIIKNAQSALKNVDTDISITESFCYTYEAVQQLEYQVSSDNDRLEKILEEISTAEKRAVSLKVEQSELRVVQNKQEQAKSSFARKQQDIHGFIERLESYSKDIKDRRSLEEKLKSMSDSLILTESEIQKLKDSNGRRNIDITSIYSLLEKDKACYQKYSDVIEGNFIDESIERLESKLKVYTSEISGKIQSLRDILEDYKRQRVEKYKLLGEYNLDEQLYIGKAFSEFEYQTITEDLERINKELLQLEQQINKIQYSIAERNSDIKYMVKSIKDKCGYVEPKQREYIRNIDFDNEKLLQKVRMKDFEKEVSRLKTQENNLKGIRFSLEEYSSFADNVNEIHAIEGDTEGFVADYIVELIKAHKKLTLLCGDAKNKLTSLYSELENEFIPKAEVFKNLFNSILDGDKRFNPINGLNAINRVYLQIDRKLAQHSIDIQKIDNMEACIIDNTLSYLKNVYDEMNNIDRNSTIEVEGKKCKMLIITLPEKEQLDSISLKEYLRSVIRNCVEMYKNGKSSDGLLSNEISTYDLFDRLVSISKVGITLIKIEPNKLKKKTWKQVIEQNSGGEKFVSAFVVFISLLTYMRGENLIGGEMESKVLIMDNPFGPITSEHLLKPLFEISQKYNTQLICLTDLKEHTIFDRFNLIYSLNIEREIGREDEYIEVKTVKKDIVIDEKEDEIISASMFRIEDKSRFELVN